MSYIKRYASRLHRAARAAWTELRQEPDLWPAPRPVTKVVLSDDEAPWSPITMLPNDTLTFTIDPAKLNKVHKIHVGCE